MTLPYRKNVAVFILNTKHEILTCQRDDEFSDWQLPQGGVDPGENLEQTLARELDEEVGLTEFNIIASLPTSITYEWSLDLHSRGFRGQEQFFYAVKPSELTWKPNFHNHHLIEFKACKWLNLVEFINCIGDSFRSASYKTAANEFQKLIPEIYKRKT